MLSPMCFPSNNLLSNSSVSQGTIKRLVYASSWLKVVFEIPAYSELPNSREDVGLNVYLTSELSSSSPIMSTFAIWSINMAQKGLSPVEKFLPHHNIWYNWGKPLELLSLVRPDTSTTSQNCRKRGFHNFLPHLMPFCGLWFLFCRIAGVDLWPVIFFFSVVDLCCFGGPAAAHVFRQASHSRDLFSLLSC